MPVVSVFCKKGGVGKTTFLGYLAHYHSNKGEKVLVLSADDQNSIFKIFGAEKFVGERDDNYFEHLLAGEAQPNDIVFEARPNMYIIKTLNTDRLSLTLTLRRPQESKLRQLIDYFRRFFDYIFIDFPPSSSRLTEILLDLSDDILLVVGLDTLGLDGFINTIQYFTDSDIDLGKVRYIVPTGYHPIKLAPNTCLKKLKTQVKTYTPDAKIISPIKEKAVIRNLQEMGVSVFDEHQMPSKFHQKNRDEIKRDLLSTFSEIKI